MFGGPGKVDLTADNAEQTLFDFITGYSLPQVDLWDAIRMAETCEAQYGRSEAEWGRPIVFPRQPAGGSCSTPDPPECFALKRHRLAPRAPRDRRGRLVRRTPRSLATRRAGGTHPATPADPQTYPNVGAESDGAHHEPGTHSDAGHPVDGSGSYRGRSEQTLTGTTSSHTITGDANKFAYDVDARAKKSTEHTQYLLARNRLAHDMGVDTKDLRVKKFDGTVERLHLNGTTQAEFERVAQLRVAVEHERVTARELNRASENLGTFAARDYLKSSGNTVIVGDHSLLAKPGTLDNIGLSPDHSELKEGDRG